MGDRFCVSGTRAVYKSRFQKKKRSGVVVRLSVVQGFCGAVDKERRVVNMVGSQFSVL